MTGPFDETTFTDITGRRQAAEALRDSEPMFKGSQALAHIGAYSRQLTGGNGHSGRLYG